MIYFHGNGEDANLSFDLLSHLRNNLDVTNFPSHSIMILCFVRLI